MKCKALFEMIDSLEEEYCALLVRACNIESPTDCKAGVDAVGSLFADLAKDRGWQVEVGRQEISGDCICITMNPDAPGQAVCFSGHMDTVHPIGAFGTPPTRLEGDMLYGPGVTDCKGGIVASLLAMDALHRVGFRSRPVKLILQSDEENGSRFSNKTTVAFMGEQAKGCIAFLNTENYKSGFLRVGMKGIRKYAYEITGRSVHSAVCYNGSSAISEAAHKILELEKYKDGDAITCNCGLIFGGVAENTVPDRCTFTADFRFKSSQMAEEVERIAKEIAERSFVEGTTCRLILKSWRYCMEKNDTNMSLLRKANAIYRENDLPILEPIETNGAADSADMTHLGIPCLDGFGAEGGKIHTREEFMYRRSLREAAKRLAAVAYCL